MNKKDLNQMRILDMMFPEFTFWLSTADCLNCGMKKYVLIGTGSGQVKHLNEISRCCKNPDYA